MIGLSSSSFFALGGNCLTDSYPSVKQLCRLAIVRHAIDYRGHLVEWDFDRGTTRQAPPSRAAIPIDFENDPPIMTTSGRNVSSAHTLQVGYRVLPAEIRKAIFR